VTKGPRALAAATLAACAAWALWSVLQPRNETPADRVAGSVADEAPLADAANFFSLPAAEQPRAFRSTQRLFATRPIRRGANVHPLPPAPRGLPPVSYRVGDARVGIDAFMARNRVAGLLIVQDGRIVLERYALGNDARTRWNSFSIGKAVVSTLLGAAVRDGFIGSIEDPVTHYLPQLRGSGYDGVSLRNMLQMSSGVRWNEDGRGRDSEILQLLHCLDRKAPGCILGFMSRLPRVAPPGTRFNYNTGETHLLGLAVAAATHQTLSAYLSEKIWAPFGMERDGCWTLESPEGAELGGGGLCMTLRDYARFGLFVLANGSAAGTPVLPDGWVHEATQPRPDSPQVGLGRLEPGNPQGYGYQWWLMPPRAPAHAGTFQAEGVFGQFLYVNPEERLVAVVWSAWPDPWIGGNETETNLFLAAVADALDRPPAPDGPARAGGAVLQPSRLAAAAADAAAASARTVSSNSQPPARAASALTPASATNTPFQPNATDSRATLSPASTAPT
jgi:CubicO group peptidase (beta-lactamase class C family)